MCVRINSIETGLAEDDLKAALTAKELPDSIVVPKVETVEHLDWVILEFIPEEHFNIRVLAKLCKRIVSTSTKMPFMSEYLIAKAIEIQQVNYVL